MHSRKLGATILFAGMLFAVAGGSTASYAVANCGPGDVVNAGANGNRTRLTDTKDAGTPTVVN